MKCWIQNTMRGGCGRGGDCVLFSVRCSSQVILTMYKPPAAAAQWRHMFIDVSGCPTVHNMAERNRHQRTDSSQSREQMSKQANRLQTVGFTSDVFTRTDQLIRKKTHNVLFICIIILRFFINGIMWVISEQQWVNFTRTRVQKGQTKPFEPSNVNPVVALFDPPWLSFLLCDI